MSFKARMAAGTAVFGLVAGGLGMAGTMTASAATPSCGNGCISLFSQKYGPSFVVDDLYQSTATGNEQILFQDSNSDQAEDFTVMDEGTVKSHYDKYDGSQSNVSSNFEQHYKNFEVVEFKYQPSGNDSGKCLSTWPGETPQAGYKIRLEPCGAYSNSLWAVDIENAVNDPRSQGIKAGNTIGLDVPLINGADNTFSSPLVLNYPVGYPTDHPRPVLNVQPESTYAGANLGNSGTVYNSQEWGGVVGPLS